MIFEFGGAPQLASPREAVWRHLQDGELMAACTPGTESFVVRGPGRYSVTCSVGAGLVRVHVVLEAELHDLVHPESFLLRATGTGPGSTLNVETRVLLEAVTPEFTRLSWNSVTSVHGMLAMFGRGMVEDTLRQFTEAFWSNVAARLTVTDSEANRAGGDEAEPPDAHDAILRLARVAAGPGVTLAPPEQGRVDLLAEHGGIPSHSRTGIARVNAVGAVAVSSWWDHRPVDAGDVIGSVAAASGDVTHASLLECLRVAGEFAPLFEVRPFVGVDGLLGQEMRLRLPADARDLPDPPAS